MESIFVNSRCIFYRAKNSQVSAKEKVRNLWVRVLIYDLQSHSVPLMFLLYHRHFSQVFMLRSTI